MIGNRHEFSWGAVLGGAALLAICVCLLLEGAGYAPLSKVWTAWHKLAAHCLPVEFLASLSWRADGPAETLDKAKNDVLDTPLLWWTEQDRFTVRDLVSGGTLVVGRSGAGKTSSSGKALSKAILKLPGSGGLILSATPSDRGMWEGIFRETGRTADLLIFGPDRPLRFNALDYIMQSGGTPRDLTKFLTVVGESLRSSDQHGGESSDFWEREQARMIYHAVVIVMLAEKRITVSSLQKFIAGAAQTPAQLKEAEWNKGYHAKLLKMAHAAPKTRTERQDCDQAFEYCLGELPALDSRTRSNISTGVFGIFHILGTGIVHELLSTSTNVTPDDLSKSRWLLVDMSPPEFGDMALAVAGTWKYLTQKTILKRRVDHRSNVVSIWVDEAHQFLTSFDSPYLAMCRARLGNMVLLVQPVNAFYAKLKGETGKAEVNALLANFSHKVFHALGDSQTADLAVSLLGKQLTTFIGGSQGPQTSLYDELMGRGHYTGNFNEQYSEVLQSNVFMNNLRTGGPANAYCCDAIVIRSGVPFSDGNNYLFCTFSQK